MKVQSCSLGIASVLVLSAGVARGGISTLVLDGYDSDPNTNALGARSISSVIFDNPFGQSADFSLDTTLSSGADMGALVFNSGIGVDQGGTVSYNNDGAGLDLNAVDLEIEGFDLAFAMVDQRFTAQIVMYTYDNSGNEIGSARWAVLVEAGVDIVAHWSFADFIIVNGAYDATNIDAIEVNFNTEDNPTTSLDFIATSFTATVPAPGAFALMGLGGIVACRRRRG